MKINEQKNVLQKLEKEQTKQNKPEEGTYKGQTKIDKLKQRKNQERN